MSEVVCIEVLSKRERDVLKLLGLGKTSKEISVLLAISITTIASHRRSICRKLAIHSTAELVHYAALLYVAFEVSHSSAIHSSN
jgi:DNA-binding CsgD family transcriptional regulator